MTKDGGSFYPVVTNYVFRINFLLQIPTSDSDLATSSSSDCLRLLEPPSVTSAKFIVGTFGGNPLSMLVQYSFVPLKKVCLADILDKFSMMDLNCIIITK